LGAKNRLENELIRGNIIRAREFILGALAGVSLPPF